MKKLSILLVLLMSVSFLHAYESYHLLGMSLGRVGVSAEIAEIKANSGYTDIGFHLNATIYGEGKNVGFFIGDTINFLNIGDSSKASNTTYTVSSKGYGMNMSVLLGPTLKPPETPLALTSFRLSPCIALGAEFEAGKVKVYSTEISYSYLGVLFGFGLDMQFTVISNKKCSFGIGANVAWYPFYSPSFKVNDKAVDIEYDSYNRFTGNLYIGITIHNKLL